MVALQTARVPFAKFEGRICAPDEVQRGQKGLTCPGCGARVRVKKGAVYVWHFAHIATDSEGCSESAIHARAKQEVAEMRVFKCANRYAKENIRFMAVHASIEEWQADLRVRPDVVLTSASGRRLFVEIVVTNDADNEKLNRLKNSAHDTVFVRPILSEEGKLTFEGIRRVLGTRSRQAADKRRIKKERAKVRASAEIYTQETHKGKSMKKETFCIIDIESKSRTPIDRGPAIYFDDPDAALICLSYQIVSRTKAGFTSGKLKTVWLDGQALPAALPAELKNFAGQFVAHNWFFEWSAFKRFAPKTFLADLSRWVCTQAMSRRFGLAAPRSSLEHVAALLKLPI